MATEFTRSTVLLLIVLNPFALSVYLMDVFRSRAFGEFLAIVLRAAFISGCVFSVFACFGQRIFSDVLQLRFAAFQVFGGIVFLLVALRFMLSGSQTLVSLRGEPGHVAGAIAMPFMIGPGTVSAAAVAGLKLKPPLALLAITCALGGTVVSMIVLKLVFDRLQRSRGTLIERYVDLTSRVSAMIVGSIAVDMIFAGLEHWRGELR